jgi:serine-type D-Ala-D-Ala carboxypeptidase (penicillin-binding protein 5/6)
MASATKLMTAYVALRELDPSERVVAGPYRAMAAESLMGLRAGDVVSVRDLLYGLLLASGNDAAVVLAEAASGSVDAFVARMNAAARRLGLGGTSYDNPIGFDAPGHHTTAADLVALTIELRGQPLFSRIVDTEEIELPDGARPRRVENRNTLLRAAPWVNGVKTGFTNDAGYVLVGSATRKGVTLVSALLGAPGEAARDAGTLELLRYGFSLYKRRTVLRERERIESVAVRDRDVAVPLVAADGVRLTARRDEDVEIQPVGVPAEVSGPVARGERLGSALVTVDGVREARVPLVAARSAAEASLLERIDAALPGRRAAAWGLLGFGALGVALFFGAAVAVIRHARR